MGDDLITPDGVVTRDLADNGIWFRARHSSINPVHVTQCHVESVALDPDSDKTEHGISIGDDEPVEDYYVEGNYVGDVAGDGIRFENADYGIVKHNNVRNETGGIGGDEGENSILSDNID